MRVVSDVLRQNRWELFAVLRYESIVLLSFVVNRLHSKRQSVWRGLENRRELHVPTR